MTKTPRLLFTLNVNDFKGKQRSATNSVPRRHQDAEVESLISSPAHPNKVKTKSALCEKYFPVLRAKAQFGKLHRS